jgi:hypothetical protein
MSEISNLAPALSIVVPTEVADLVRGSLFPKNDVGRASVEFYAAVLAEVGIEDLDSLSFAETVEVTRRLYSVSSDYRRDRKDVAKIAREEAKAAAKAKRDAERAERIAKEIAEAEARLARLKNGG